MRRLGGAPAHRARAPVQGLRLVCERLRVEEQFVLHGLLLRGIRRKGPGQDRERARGQLIAGVRARFSARRWQLIERLIAWAFPAHSRKSNRRPAPPVGRSSASQSVRRAALLIIEACLHTSESWPARLRAPLSVFALFARKESSTSVLTVIPRPRCTRIHSETTCDASRRAIGEAPAI